MILELNTMNDFKTSIQNLFFIVPRIFLQYKVPKLKTLSGSKVLLMNL